MPNTSQPSGLFSAWIIFIVLVAFSIAANLLDDWILLGPVMVASLAAVPLGIIAIHLLTRGSPATPSNKSSVSSVLLDTFLAFIVSCVLATASIMITAYFFQLQQQWDGGLAGIVWVIHPGLLVFILTFYFYMRIASVTRKNKQVS